MAEEEEETPLLLPCSICNRTFIPLSLEKHRKICEKTATKKRGVFNSFKQRLQGTGLEEFLPLSQININSTLNISESKWRQKHLDFVNTVRQARGRQGSSTETKRNTPSNTGRKSSTSNETCPYCQRSFGIKAFDRHLEWCKEQKARIPKSTPPSQAKERLEARTKYRAPLGSKSKRTTKEKYSSITNAVKPKSPAACGSNVVKSPAVSIVKDDKRNQGLKPVKNKDVQHSPVTGNKRAETATVRRVSTPSRIKSSTTERMSPMILGNSPVINKQKKCATSQPRKSISNADLFGGAVNRRNRRNDSITNRETPEVYDPFVSAERQMQELMEPEEQCYSEEKADTQRHKDQQSPTFSLPISNELCSSPVSAFAKYSFFKSEDELGSYLERLQDENQSSELSYPKSEEKDSTAMLQKISLSVLPVTSDQQTIAKTEHTSEVDSFHDLHPMSLDNLDSDFDKDSIIMIENDTCSEVDTIDGSFDFNSFPFDMENLENEIERIVGKRKKSTKYRAKFESAALALQQSVSLYHPGPIAKPSEEFFLSSDNETKSSSHLFQKESFIHSLKDLNSINSQEKRSAVSKPVTSENENYIDAIKADDTENEIYCLIDTQGNAACAAGSKLSGDSAYSSLNRKSPSAEVTQQVFEVCQEVPLELPELNVGQSELPEVASCEPRQEPEDPGTPTPPHAVSSSQFNSSSKLSNFCHNCGLRYPVLSAKFCCECGIKRLCI